MRKYNRKKKKKIDFVADNTPLVLSHLTPKQNTYARDFKKRKFFLLFFLCGEGGGPLPTSIIPSNRHLQNCLNAPFRSTGCNRGSNNRSEETRVMNQEKKQQRDESFFKKEKKQEEMASHKHMRILTNMQIRKAILLCLPFLT